MSSGSVNDVDLVGSPECSIDGCMDYLNCERYLRFGCVNVVVCVSSFAKGISMITLGSC